MIKLALSESVENLRQELKSWLANNPPPTPTKDTSLATFERIGKTWQEQLAAGRWIGVHWPEEFGGRGLSLVEEAIIQEELTRVSAPQILGLFGLTMVGPVLIRYGTQQQRTRFLANILNGTEIWCQGFSEPGAGSDLAAVKTRAVPVEGGFRINGHKIWTSFAHIANWCFVLCRTQEGVKRHEGLTYLLVDMKSPGITTRPLRQISGDEEFNEVFFDNVFVPTENVVGQQGQGWSIAIATLMFERVVLTFARQLQSDTALRELLRYTDEQKSTEQHAITLASFVADACATRALAYEHLMSYAEGKDAGPEGSLDKLLWSETFQRLCSFAMQCVGPSIVFGEHGPRHGSLVHRYLYSRGRTIAAGTSEIQRSIIAERLLGLPRLNYQLPKR